MYPHTPPHPRSMLHPQTYSKSPSTSQSDDLHHLIQAPQVSSTPPLPFTHTILKLIHRNLKTNANVSPSPIVDRSPSLRNSAASRITVSPIANAPATAKIGNSSIKLGISSPSITVPCNIALEPATDPRVTRRHVRHHAHPPPSASTHPLTTPLGRGFNPTFSISITAPSRAAAATNQKAAEENHTRTARPLKYRTRNFRTPLPKLAAPQPAPESQKVSNSFSV